MAPPPTPFGSGPRPLLMWTIRARVAALLKKSLDRKALAKKALPIHPGGSETKGGCMWIGESKPYDDPYQHVCTTPKVCTRRIIPQIGARKEKKKKKKVVACGFIITQSVV